MFVVFETLGKGKGVHLSSREMSILYHSNCLLPVLLPDFFLTAPAIKACSYSPSDLHSSHSGMAMVPMCAPWMGQGICYMCNPVCTPFKYFLLYSISRRIKLLFRPILTPSVVPYDFMQ